jgi:hypothetical protein
MGINTDNLTDQELIDIALKAMPEFEKGFTPKQHLLTGEKINSYIYTYKYRYRSYGVYVVKGNAGLKCLSVN